MSLHHTPSIEDELMFNTCVLRLVTLPRALLTFLREKRTSIARDLGVRSVATYVLCCRVLERLSHIPSPKKQAKAVRRLQVMLVGGLTKKRKGLRRPGASSETRDRVIPHIERRLFEYICADFERAFSCDMNVSTLRNDVCKSDLLLQSVLDTLKNAPSLHGILPVSIISFVFLIVEMMFTGATKSLREIDAAALQEFQHYELYCALERITMECLKEVHGGSGVLSGGSGRPHISPCSAYGRDGELIKLALSNKSLAGALLIGARMIAQSNLRKGQKRVNEDKFGLNTFFPFLKDAVIHRKDESREYNGLMEDADDFLDTAGEVAFVADHNLKPFLQSYDTLLKCNRLSVVCFRGPGVIFRSDHVPDVIRVRHIEKHGGKSPIQESVLDVLDGEIRSFRRDKAYCYDSEVEMIRVHEKDVTCYSCPFSKDLCHFLYDSLRLAENVASEIWEEHRDNKDILKVLEELRRNLFRDLTLGLFASDLSGNIATLYEHYVFSSLMRHFHERDGIPKMLRAPEKRRTIVRKPNLRKNVVKSKLHSSTHDDPGYFAPDDEEWGPNSTV